MSETGDYIREARQQKGLTLQQVAEATRIPSYYLEILEGGGDDRLVSDRLYMVHFLRSYAAFLEIEQESLAAQFVRENRKLQPAENLPEPRTRSWKGIVGAALAVLLATGIGVYLYDPSLVVIGGVPGERPVASSTPTPTTPEAPAPPPAPAPSAAPRTETAESSVLQPEANETDPSRPRLVATPPAPRPEPVAAAAPEPGPEPVTTVQDQPAQDSASSTEARDLAVSTEAQDPRTATTTPDVATPQLEETAAAASDTGQTPPTAPDTAATDSADATATHSLTIAADEESWLRVWVDDGKSRDMLLNAGETRTLSAQTGYVITFGNAGGVRLTLNGEELPPAGRSGQVVRGFKLPPAR